MLIRTFASAIALVLFLAAGLAGPEPDLSGRRAQGRDGRHRSDGLRRRSARRVQGPHPWRPAQRHRHAPQPDPRAARRRPARQHRRHRRHERQPGLHRWPARRRGVVFARSVLEGTDRGHHADRRNDRGGDVRRTAAPGRARRAADAAHAGESRARRCVRPSAGCGRSPTARTTCRCSATARSTPASARCCGRLPRR